jgi:hypothetical protein
MAGKLKGCLHRIRLDQKEERKEEGGGGKECTVCAIGDFALKKDGKIGGNEFIDGWPAVREEGGL